MVDVKWTVYLSLTSRKKQPSTTISGLLREYLLVEKASPKLQRLPQHLRLAIKTRQTN